MNYILAGTRCLAIVAIVLPHFARAADDAVIVAFKKASQERREKIKTARFSWEADKIPIPGLVKWDRKLAFDRDHLRYDWVMNNKQRKQRAKIFDRPANTLFTLTDTPRRDEFEYPEAILESQESYTPPDFLPLTWMYRMSDYPFSATTDEWTVTDRGEQLLPGGKCIVLEQKAANPTASLPAAIQEYWVCPEMDYVVLRFALRGRRSRGTEIDVSYGRDEKFGWVPLGWIQTGWNRDGSAISRRQTCKVTDYALNEPLPDDVFEHELPDGTIYHDLIAKRVYRVENGVQREMTAEEKKRTYLGFSSEPRVGEPPEPPPE